MRHTQVKNLEAPSTSSSHLPVPMAGRPAALAPVGLGMWSVVGEVLEPRPHLASPSHAGRGRRRQFPPPPPKEPTPPESLAWRPRAGRPPAWTPERPALPHRPTGRAPSGLERRAGCTPPALQHWCAGARAPWRCSSKAAGQESAFETLGHATAAPALWATRVRGDTPPACLLPASPHNPLAAWAVPRDRGKGSFPFRLGKGGTLGWAGDPAPGHR